VSPRYDVSEPPDVLGERRKALWLRALGHGYVDAAERRLAPITDPAVSSDQVAAYRQRVARRDFHLRRTVPTIRCLSPLTIGIGCLFILIGVSTRLLLVTLAVVVALWFANRWADRVKAPLPAADWDQVDLVSLRAESRNMLIHAREAADIARAFAARAPGVTVGEVDRAVTEDVWRVAILLRDGDAEVRDRPRLPGNIASYRLARRTVEALLALAEQILAAVEADTEQAETDAAAEQAAARRARLDEARRQDPASGYLATILTPDDEPGP
jgi:hypothetical protein